MVAQRANGATGSSPEPRRANEIKRVTISGAVHPERAGTKRRRIACNADKGTCDDTGYELARGTHPFGVKPLGNLYFDQMNGARSVREDGLGLLGKLDDELLMGNIFSLLDAKDLGQLAQCSRAAYAYSHHDALWRELVLKDHAGDFDFRNTWKQTWVDKHCGGEEAAPTIDPIPVEGVYSDYLFQPWFCASMGVDPSWLRVDNIDRRSNLSLQEFIEQYERPNKPVVITDVVTKWPAFGKWDMDYLVKKHPEVVFRAGPIDLSLDRYWKYASQTKEDAPLYLFDKHFAANAPDLAEDYTVPEYFSEDLFQLVGEDRPDYRWIIIGPARSGSTFHRDPNFTSAWNAVIRGRKKWVFYPPTVTPPGVIVSEDQYDVATPLSLNEWFSNFYKETKESDVRPIECVVEEGEVIFVPSGWWHVVMNLDVDSIAITQNYVSRRNLVKVLDYLRDNPCDVSGCRNDDIARTLHEKLRSAFVEKYPGELEGLEAEYRETEKAKACKKTMWDTLKESASADAGGFSFGF